MADIVPFSRRHIGPSPDDEAIMLKEIGASSLDQLMDETIPQDIRQERPLDLPPPLSESQILKLARSYANQNKVFRTYIGMGYYGTHTPSVIQRSVLENPN